MQYTFPKRFSCGVDLTVEIDAEYETASNAVKLEAALCIVLGLHAKWLRGEDGGVRADLCGADLRNANLRDADLRDADLRDADLRNADLRGASLCGANLRDADLCGADLRNAYLRDADLRNADLRGASLCGANLRDADLRNANLSDANLSDANLRGVKIRNGVTINRRPLQLFGLHYPVTIYDEHMKIGCEFHAIAEWREFNDHRIAEMGGCAALRFWHQHKTGLLVLASGDGRGTAQNVESNQEAA